MKSRISYYAAVWWRLAQMAFLMQLANFWSSLGWLGGKLIRLIFFVCFIVAIFKHVRSVAGYSFEEIALFFLTFNLIDVAAQLFLRGIYMVGRDIREGDMDFYLIHPLHPLFRLASNMVDFLDFLTLVPILVLLAFTLTHILAPFSPPQIALKVSLYFVLCWNGMLIAFSIHVFIAALTLRTQQMENTIWMYRDISSLGRFPCDVYARPLRDFLTYILPIGVMVTFPAQALLGILSVGKMISAFLICGIFLTLSIRFWNNSVRHYCSTSS